MAAATRKTLTLALAAGLAWASPAGAQQDGAWVARAQEAAQALQKGNADQALALYGEALADRTLPNDRRTVILNDRGVAFARKQQFKSAIEDFNRAVQLNPEHAPTYNNRGNVLVQLGQAREAVRDFDRAIVLAPTYSAAFTNRASAYVTLGQADRAVGDFTRAIELNPQNMSAFNGRGHAHLSANRPYAAARDFSRAVQINPGFATAYRNRASALSRLDRTDDSIEDLSRALAFDPRSVESTMRRGDAYLAVGNAASALKDFNRAIELAPQSAAAFVGRGFSSAKAEAFDEALGDLARAIEIEPRLARAYAVRAWVYKQTQQPELGQKDVERALKLEPVTADAYWAQGEIEEAFARTDTAAAAYAKALAADPLHRDAIAGLERLGLKSYRDEQEVADAGFERWRVIVAAGQYFAVNETIPKMRVSLEVYGALPPKILDWDRRKAPFVGIGVLRYAAGTLEGSGEIESAAVIDVQRPAVIATEMHRNGSKTATWTWGDGQLKVAGADGLVEEFALRQAKPKDAIAAKDGEPATAANDATAKAKRVADGERPKTVSAPAQSRPAPRPQKSKSLFDLIFGN